jgi:hypothetical protein
VRLFQLEMLLCTVVSYKFSCLSKTVHKKEKKRKEKSENYACISNIIVSITQNIKRPINSGSVQELLIPFPSVRRET